MPAKNPRLTITLQPAVHAAFRNLSQLTGESQSSLIASMLEQSLPVIERTCVVLAAAERAKESMREKVAEDLGHAQAKIEQQIGLALDGFESYTGELLKEAEKVQRRSRARAAGGAERLVARPAAASSTTRPTPPSNRGVRSTPKTTKKPTRRRT